MSSSNQPHLPTVNKLKPDNCAQVQFDVEPCNKLVKQSFFGVFMMMADNCHSHLFKSITCWHGFVICFWFIVANCDLRAEHPRIMWNDFGGGFWGVHWMAWLLTIFLIMRFFVSCHFFLPIVCLCGSLLQRFFWCVFPSPSLNQQLSVLMEVTLLSMGLGPLLVCTEKFIGLIFIGILNIYTNKHI